MAHDLHEKKLDVGSQLCQQYFSSFLFTPLLCWPGGDDKVLSHSTGPSNCDDGCLPKEVTLVPLGTVIEDAVKRWFEDTYRDAQRGDVKQQALLGQMLAEGYGCEQDIEAAEEWTERARKRRYRMQGVYCQL